MTTEGLTMITTALTMVSFTAVLFYVLTQLRRVVPTNMVHTVQSRKATTSYGAQLEAGNVYYKWPAWLPRFGVTVIELPVSNFSIDLNDYEAYDTDRVPFIVDVTSFFRIKDTNVAARRVSSIQQLIVELDKIVKGTVRKVLASDNIDSIMLERAKFGKQFSEEITNELSAWGVEEVKQMELMDIRDALDSKVVHNIMAKKKSHIEAESRKEVASNQKEAESAEIEARREVALRNEEAQQAIGQREAQKRREVGLANEKANQGVLQEQKVTREREMDVQRVQEVNAAQIDKDRAKVAAEQDRETTVIIAEGKLEEERKAAEAVQVRGEAEASAAKAMELAPVQAQIELAKEIGDNTGYQEYLKTLEAVRAYLQVGVKQAEALKDADVKVIANADSATGGVTNAMDLFSSKGGTQIAGLVEALSQSPVAREFLEKLTGNGESTDDSDVEF